MNTVLDHPLSKALHAAAIGRFPEADKGTEVGGALPGPCDAAQFYGGHVVVAADVSESWVLDHLSHEGARRRPNDFSNWLGIFLAALSKQLGNPPSYASVVTVAPHIAANLPGEITPGGEVGSGWAAYHTDVRSYQYAGQSGAGTIGLGRGPGERWDVYIRVEGAATASARRELLAAAKTVVPRKVPLFGSAPLHDPGALRLALSGGFQPVCTEVLFLTRPKT